MTSPSVESTFGRLYRMLYDALCGRHPNLRPWHFQWLAVRPLYACLHSLLPGVGGAERAVLDVGCGDKPYRSWFGAVRQYVGIDVYPGPEVDVVVAPGATWPFADNQFDVILCAQVLEHVEHLEHTVSEISRVLKPNGKAIVTVPFLYNEHGAPFDFRRFTVHGVRHLFDRLTVESIGTQGGVGSTMVIIFLNWWDQAFTRNYPMRLLKALLLPVTVVLSTALNMVGLLLDSIDRTQSFYSNVVMVLRKEGRTAPSNP